MMEDRDRMVGALLDRHTPDEAEAPDWARVVRAAEPRSSWRRLPVRRLRWIPTAVGALALLALVAALIVATPDGRDAAPSASPVPDIAAVTLRAYLRDDASASELDRFRAALAELREEGRIVSFSYRSKEAALEDLRARLKDPSILDELPGNPVPASFEIQLPRGADPQGIVADLSTEPALDSQLGIESA